MGKLDSLAVDLGRRFQVAPDVAHSALCLVLRAHHGDEGAGKSVAALATQPRTGPLLVEALHTLQREPSFWVSYYATAGREFTTGDFFSDVAHVVSDPGKALSKAVHDITHDPLGSLANVAQGLINAAVPIDLLAPIPGLGSIVQIAKSFLPTTQLGKLAQAALHGNLQGVVDVAKSELGELQTVAALVPGIGTGVSVAIGTAEALLSGGNPIEVALRAAYGAIPIPPGIRDITDTVLDAVISLLHGGNLTDAALTIARDRIPEGVPRDVFDTLAQIIVRHKPVMQAAGELAAHEAAKAAQGLAPALMQGIAKNIPPGAAALLSKLPDPTKRFQGLPANVLGVSGLLDKLAPSMKKQASAKIAPIAASMAKRVVARPSPPRPPPAPALPSAADLDAMKRALAQAAAPKRVVSLRLGPAHATAPALPRGRRPSDPYDMFLALMP